jgi:hypothetical protein
MWTTSLDLMDAYFHIPFVPAFRKCLRFVWDNTVYQFRSLPFGISTAPLVFTRVFQTVIAHLHSVCSDSFLSRRFSDQGSRSTNSCFPNGNGNSAFSKSGVFDLLEEVGVDSF